MSRAAFLRIFWLPFYFCSSACGVELLSASSLGNSKGYILLVAELHELFKSSSSLLIFFDTISGTIILKAAAIEYTMLKMVYLSLKSLNFV